MLERTACAVLDARLLPRLLRDLSQPPVSEHEGICAINLLSHFTLMLVMRQVRAADCRVWLQLTAGSWSHLHAVVEQRSLRTRLGPA